MTSTRLFRTILSGLLGGALCIAFSGSAAAQVQSQTSVAEGQAAREVTIERGEIVNISGNSVVIKMEDGSVRHFDNVPDSVSFMVDGKPVNIHNAKVGMKLQRETVRTTTPRMVTKVETVTGKVWSVALPDKVTLTLPNNQNQTFNIPKGQIFMVEGKPVDASGLRRGMTVSAQKVTTAPETVVAEEYRRTGTAPPPPAPVKADVPILVVYVEAPAPAPIQTASAAEPAPTQLPRTASDLPLIGLLGALLCVISLTVTSIRKISGFAAPRG